MKLLIAALVILGIAAAVVELLRKQKRGGVNEWPMTSRPILTAPEQVLFFRLRSAFPEYLILSQVALSQLLEVRKVQGRQAVFNRISQLVADFVVCRPDFNAVAVIELDDRSHERPQRAAADGRKSAALAAAGVPLLRFNVKAIPSEGELTTAVKRLLPTSPLA